MIRQQRKSSKAKKQTSREARKQRYKRRRLLTFWRMVKYGASNFVRNAWLTVAATAVMTLTLVIIFVAAAANSAMLDTVEDLKDKVDMSIYLKYDTTDEEGYAAPVASRAPRDSRYDGDPVSGSYVEDEGEEESEDAWDLTDRGGERY